MTVSVNNDSPRVDAANPAGAEPLAPLLMRLRPLAPQAAVSLVALACDALRDLHGRGLAHGQLSPFAILVAPGADGLSLVLPPPNGDDGPAPSSTQVRFVAPEILAGDAMTPAADVWALGLIAYYALTGAIPGDDLGSGTDVRVGLAQGELTPIQDLAPWVDGTLARIIHAAVLPESFARWPTAAALGDALEGCARPTRLTRTMLRPASANERAKLAPRAVLPSHCREVVRAFSPRALAPTLGRYRLVKLLGHGGMGEVHEAETPDGERVAVKVLLDDVRADDPSLRRRLVREGVSTRSIESPHVVRVLDADDGATGTPFLVMELLLGADLGSLIKQRGALAEKPVTRLFVQACRGLRAAHERGIIHRDIKPSNLYVDAREGKPLCLKLCDFGVAKATAFSAESTTTSDLTATGGMLGSPVYMSPEQIRNAKSVDGRADLWSLAVSLYEALSARRPWEGSVTMAEFILAICTRPARPLREVAPWVSPGLAAVIDRALSIDIDARYGTAAELEAAIGPFASPDEVADLDGLSAADVSAVGWADTVQQTSAAPSNAGTTAPAGENRRSSIVRRVVAVALVLGAVVGAAVFARRQPIEVTAVPSAPSLPPASPSVPASAFASPREAHEALPPSPPESSAARGASPLPSAGAVPSVRTHSRSNPHRASGAPSPAAGAPAPASTTTSSPPPKATASAAMPTIREDWP